MIFLSNNFKRCIVSVSHFSSCFKIFVLKMCLSDPKSDFSRQFLFKIHYYWWWNLNLCFWLKQLNNQRCLEGEAKQNIPHQSWSKIKIVLTVFIDCFSVVHYKFLLIHQTANKDHLSVFCHLQKLVYQKLSKIWQKKQKKTWVLQHYYSALLQCNYYSWIFIQTFNKYISTSTIFIWNGTVWLVLTYTVEITSSWSPFWVH